MGAIHTPHRVKPFVGLLAHDPALFDAVRRPLERLFGAIDIESPIIDFTYTDYYTGEMGSDLKRRFYAFGRLVMPDTLLNAKTRSNMLESRYAADGKRRINIDPGYLDLAKVVLFTTKDYSHRIHLRKGIFAETTLSFRDGHFAPWPWTYPDYRTVAYHTFFAAARNAYRQGIATSREGRCA